MSDALAVAIHLRFPRGRLYMRCPVLRFCMDVLCQITTELGAGDWCRERKFTYRLTSRLPRNRDSGTLQKWLLLGVGAPDLIQHLPTRKIAKNVYQLEMQPSYAVACASLSPHRKCSNVFSCRLRKGHRYFCKRDLAQRTGGSCVYRCPDEQKEDPTADEEIRSCLPNPQGKSVPADAEGDPDEEHVGKPCDTIS